jgi:hypothetical protein
MLGVVVNRAETKTDGAAYYYAQKHYQTLAAADEDAEAAEDDHNLEMIYVAEDVVS